MNKFSFLAVLIMFSLFANSQNRNVNPNKNAEPWILGGLRLPSQAEIDKIPVIENSYNKNAKDLPATLDNSTKQYFRPIFSQTDGCCAQASGVAYNFTYEINRKRNTSASTSINQYPTHYTYNFLNGGSGDNGSWMSDGWEIIKANGIPNVAEYGGSLNQDPSYWMSGYNDYSVGQDNRVSEIFSIDVGTPEGLISLKHWMYDHLEGDADGSIVNFAAGISDGDYNITWNSIITKWHNSANHAMTFVGWDDNVEYDFNGDGQITNDADINGDGIVNMQDWEKGALIMVNSWGTSWGDNGKAYVMYKLLADPIAEGGIFSNKVYAIKTKNTSASQLNMKVKMEHNSRNRIKIYAGVASNLSAISPEHIINFSLFNKQGGSFDMRGTSSLPIEITLDITALLSYINSGENAKFFLLVDEIDEDGINTGQVYDFSIVNNSKTEYISTQHNVAIVNNGTTSLSVNAAISFDAPNITTTSLPVASPNQNYSYQLAALGGQAPYNWLFKIDYNEEALAESFPNATNQLTPNNDDDGFAVQTLDFNFPFYGNEFNELFISTDGSIIFDDNFSYLRSEDAIRNSRVISVFASDLMIYPASGDGIFYSGDANSATFRWKTSLYGDDTANVDVAVTLYPSGKIEFFYGVGITSGLNWASGVSNGDGFNYSISSNSGVNVPSNNRLKYTTTPFPVGMQISSDGLFGGIPTKAESSWDVSFIVVGNNNISKTKTLNFETSTVGVDEIKESNISIYPNPTNSFVTIKTKNKLIEIIRVYSVSGKLIKNISVNKEKYILNLQKEDKGIYFIEIHTKKQNIIKRVVVL